MGQYLDAEKKKQLASHKSSDDLLKEALRRRDAYLEAHPHLKNFQEEIDGLLDKAGNKENRMAVLGMLMEGKLLELGRHLSDLGRILSQDRE
jgi:hypothetical protein